MSPFICYHVTRRRNRRSILQRGLRARNGGVYAFSPHLSNHPDKYPVVVWVSGPGQDLWQIAYVGPMGIDPLLENAVILPSVTDVTLVTGNE